LPQFRQHLVETDDKLRNFFGTLHRHLSIESRLVPDFLHGRQRRIVDAN